MAIQSPPGSVVPMAAGPPTAPRKSGCFGRGCGCGCGGCLLALVLVALLVFGGGYFFFVAQASAAVTAPASLDRCSTTRSWWTATRRGGSGAEPQRHGPRQVSPATRRSSCPDGSFVRLLRHYGDPQAVSSSADERQPAVGELIQEGGPDLYQRRAPGLRRELRGNGHSVSAQVRGTQFEVLVRPDGTNLIKVFVRHGHGDGQHDSSSSTAGQQIDADANGRLSGQPAIQPFDVPDPYPLAAQCKQDVVEWRRRRAPPSRPPARA